jgi:hypothetical protein
MRTDRDRHRLQQLINTRSAGDNRPSPVDPKPAKSIVCQLPTCSPRRLISVAAGDRRHATLPMSVALWGPAMSRRCRIGARHRCLQPKYDERPEPPPDVIGDMAIARSRGEDDGLGAEARSVSLTVGVLASGCSMISSNERPVAGVQSSTRPVVSAPWGLRDNPSSSSQDLGRASRGDVLNMKWPGWAPGGIGALGSIGFCVANTRSEGPCLTSHRDICIASKAAAG